MRAGGQITEAMKANNISRSSPATRMKTNRRQIGRLLDPKVGAGSRAFDARLRKTRGSSSEIELNALSP